MKYCRTVKQGQLLTVTISRPAVLNSLHAPACFELDEIWDDFEADPGLSVAILTGEGRAFCAGHDLVSDPEEPMPATGFGALPMRRGRSKPIIAAINGMALGGGLEMALACDILIAEEGAKFSLPEARYGGAALSGGIQRLARSMPPAIAMGILLTGRTFDAAEAFRWGMLTEVVPRGEALAAAIRMAGQILVNSPLGTKYTLIGALEVIETPEPVVDSIARQMRDYTPIMMATQDMAEGLAAFAEKREPVWKGR